MVLPFHAKSVLYASDLVAFSLSIYVMMSLSSAMLTPPYILNENLVSVQFTAQVAVV